MEINTVSSERLPHFPLLFFHALYIPLGRSMTALYVLNSKRREKNQDLFRTVKSKNRLEMLFTMQWKNMILEKTGKPDPDSTPHPPTPQWVTPGILCGPLPPQHPRSPTWVELLLPPMQPPLFLSLERAVERFSSRQA